MTGTEVDIGFPSSLSKPMRPHYSKLLAIAAMLLGSSWVNAAGPEIVYYDVQGDTGRELRTQLDTKGPIGEGGKRADGHTSWNVAWTYRYAPVAESCQFTELEVTLTSTIVLPRWAGDGASSALAKKWQSYLAALRLHEDGHYSHGVSAAEEIKALAQSVHPRDGCSTIAKQFDDQAASILEKYKSADATYDADTKHGLTQGAVFP